MQTITLAPAAGMREQLADTPLAADAAALAHRAPG
jgi:hypothetical protein